MDENKDTRLIFLESIEPFLSLESHKQVSINIDIIEQRLASNGYFGALYKRLQAEVDELRKQSDVARHDITLPEGYTEINIMYCYDSIKRLGINIEDVSGVFLGKGELIITGSPKEDDDAHNCDVMGCTSVSHVLYRKEI